MGFSIDNMRTYSVEEERHSWIETQETSSAVIRRRIWVRVVALLSFLPLPLTMDNRILIIDGGLCGLGAAIAIPLEDHQVVVFESAPEVHQVQAAN